MNIDIIAIIAAPGVWLFQNMPWWGWLSLSVALFTVNRIIRNRYE